MLHVLQFHLLGLEDNNLLAPGLSGTGKQNHRLLTQPVFTLFFTHWAVKGRGAWKLSSLVTNDVNREVNELPFPLRKESSVQGGRV